jgi:hypothetical protein
MISTGRKPLLAGDTASPKGEFVIVKVVND